MADVQTEFPNVSPLSIPPALRFGFMKWPFNLFLKNRIQTDYDVQVDFSDVPAGPDPKLCKMCFPAPPCFRLTLTENDQRNLAHATQQLVLTSVCV